MTSKSRVTGDDDGPNEKNRNRRRLIDFYGGRRLPVWLGGPDGDE
jgi:hypothetical protein